MEACAENLESVLKRELERRYPGCQVRFQNVQKNNGLMLRGVVIAAPGDNVVPTVYIDEYLAKGYSAGEICEEVSRLYEENRDTGALETDLTDFEAVCKKICFKLINAELNEDFLKTAPQASRPCGRILYPAGRQVRRNGNSPHQLPAGSPLGSG